MKKIYYWSPYLTRVGTYKATINSLIGFAKYSKNYEVYIIKILVENGMKLKLLIKQ